MIRLVPCALSALTIAAVVLYFCDIKYTIKFRGISSYLSAIAVGVLSFVAEVIFGNLYASVALFMGFVFFAAVVCRARIISAVFSGGLLSIILLCCQICAILFMSAVFSAGLNEITAGAFLNVCSSVFSLAVFIFAVYIILRFTDKTDNYSSTSFVLLIMPIVSFLTSVIMTKMYFSYKLSEDIALLLAALNLLLLISSVVVFYVHDYAVKSRRYADKIKNEYQLWKNRDEYYTELEEQNQNSRVLMHDITKHLNTIGNISSGEVTEYISKISDDFGVSNPINYSSTATLNLITHRFYEKCIENNIRFDVNIREAKLDFMTAPDITALFDNLLENAFESAISSEEKQIDFTAYLRNRNFIIIRLTNSCDIKPKHENGELITNKKSPFHGIGTKSIKRVVKKHDGDIDMKFNEDEGTFESTIMLRAQQIH